MGKGEDLLHPFEPLFVPFFKVYKGFQLASLQPSKNFLLLKKKKIAQQITSEQSLKTNKTEQTVCVSSTSARDFLLLCRTHLVPSFNFFSFSSPSSFLFVQFIKTLKLCLFHCTFFVVFVISYENFVQCAFETLTTLLIGFWINEKKTSKNTWNYLSWKREKMRKQQKPHKVNQTKPNQI